MNNKTNPYTVEYPATYDIIFHNAFSNQETLASFTSALLNITIQPEEIQILTPKLSEGIKFKTSYMDIRYSIINKMDIDIEMQKDKPNYNIEDRLVYYVAQQIVSSMEKGEVYRYKRCCTICITNFSLFKSKECIKHFELRDKEEGIKIRGIEVITIDLTKKDKCDNIELKKWLEIITATDFDGYKGGNRVMDQTIERIIESNKDKDIQEIILMKKREEFEEKMKRSAELEFKEEQERFKEERKNFKEERDNFKEERNNFNKKQEKFYEERKKFHEKQKKLNEKEYQFEKQRIEFAKSLLGMNMEMEEVSKITGLSVERINNLK